MFIFNGISSSDMGIYVEEITNILGKAQQRTQIEDIDGFNGEREEAFGYKRISRSLTLYLTNKENLDDVLSWLNGKGLFEYDNRITFVSIFGSVEPTRVATGYKIDLQLIRDPFWFRTNETYEIYTNQVVNEGNVSVTPLIKLKKKTSNTCELRINDIQFKYTFNEHDTEVEIDCLNKTAEYNGLRRNRNLEIGFDYPILAPGENKITLISGNVEILMKRKDAWL